MLDLVFSSDKLLLGNIEQISPLGKSDHVSIIFDIQCYTQSSKHCSVNYAYKYVNSRRKVNTGISNLKRDDGTVAETDTEKADDLNFFFKSVFVKENVSNISNFHDRSGGILVDNIIINEEIVKKLIEKLNINKSYGPDLLHPRVLKELRESITTPQTLIFKSSFQNGEIVNDWKTANVKALFKKGSRDNPGNYRPISLTCIPCKLMEKLVRDAIVNHMTLNKLFSDSQYGFRSLRSCALQLLDVMEKWTEWLDESSSFDCIYYDFAKAFDSVPHARLLVKLEAYGIKGKLLDWVKAFLSQRKQRVVVNSSKSAWADVSSGVPQGSVLGPVLFLVYINDIEDAIRNILRLFADDTKLFGCTNTDTDIEDLQLDNDDLNDWSGKWLLKFNVGKCCTLHYGYNNPNHTYQMYENGIQKEIVNSDTVKDLGITFDTELKFRKHINDCINKGNRITGLIRRSFLHINCKSFSKLFKTLIRPILEYRNIIWSPRFKKDIEAIERVQKRATKLVHNVRNMSYSDRLKALKLPSLTYRRFRADMIQVYELMHNLEDIPFTRFFELNENPTRYQRSCPQVKEKVL